MLEIPVCRRGGLDNVEEGSFWFFARCSEFSDEGLPSHGHQGYDVPTLLIMFIYDDKLSNANLLFIFNFYDSSNHCRQMHVLNTVALVPVSSLEPGVSTHT